MLSNFLSKSRIGVGIVKPGTGVRIQKDARRAEALKMQGAAVTGEEHTLRIDCREGFGLAKLR